MKHCEIVLNQRVPKLFQLETQNRSLTPPQVQNLKKHIMHEQVFDDKKPQQTMNLIHEVYLISFKEYITFAE